MDNRKNGFSIVVNNAEELESLTGGGSMFFNSTRNCVTKSFEKKKCFFATASFAVLSLLILGTVFILKTALQDHQQQIIIDESLQKRIFHLEQRVDELTELYEQQQKQISTQNENHHEASGDYRSHLTDDENLLEPASVEKKSFISSIVGKWTQIRMENMDEYLTAEGASWIFRRMALSIPPELEIHDYGEKKYAQIFTAPMYRGEFPIWNNGETMYYEDGNKDDVVGEVTDTGDSVVIVAVGGKNGPIKSSLYYKGDELFLTTELLDKGVKASRVFTPKVSRK